MASIEDDPPTSERPEPRPEDPEEKFARFGAHEIPLEVRHELIKTELRRVDPERFKDTAPPNGSALEAPPASNPEAAAHSAKLPPVALQVEEPEQRVIIAEQKTILSARKAASPSLDPEALTIPGVRSVEERRALARRIVIGMVVGVVVSLGAIALTRWPRSEPAKNDAVAVEPVEATASEPIATSVPAPLPSATTSSSPVPAPPPASPPHQPAEPVRTVAPAVPAPSPVVRDPALPQAKPQPPAAPAPAPAPSAKSGSIFDTLPRPPM
jgi:hypothetical protein